MTRILVPAIIALLLVGGLVAVGVSNRSGETAPLLTLTERELSLSSAGGELAQEGALRLRFVVDPRSDPLDARNWLTLDRLRAIGFAVDVPPGSPDARDTYRRAPRRIAWVAFEYDGPAAADAARRRAVTDQATLEQGPWRGGIEPSRLVPVDADLDREALARRLSAAHLILRAVIFLRLHESATTGAVLYGGVQELVPPEMIVPRHLQQPLRDLAPPELPPPDRSVTTSSRAPRAPRFDVDVAVGRFGIPYVARVGTRD
jgi:hypothetical protein